MNHLQKKLDNGFEAYARMAARSKGRRSMMAKIGAALVGVAVAQVLPFDRRGWAVGSDWDEDDPCDYWRHCGLDGVLCSTAGGSMTSCPAGSSPSKVSWFGTCTNPEDNKAYLVSYNDCCGKTAPDFGTSCKKAENERPGYRMGVYSDVNWCMANDEKGYHCTVSIVVGIADE